MYLNQATDYAFRAVLYLSHQPMGKVIDSQIIAERENIPTRFLLKIMPSLIQAGIVRSQRGAGGGYALNRSPEEISLLDVLEAVEGPVTLSRCLADPDFCSKKSTDSCLIYGALGEIQDKIAEELSGYTFGELMKADPVNRRELVG